MHTYCLLSLGKNVRVGDGIRVVQPQWDLAKNFANSLVMYGLRCNSFWAHCSFWAKASETFRFLMFDHIWWSLEANFLTNTRALPTNTACYFITNCDVGWKNWNLKISVSITKGFSKRFVRPLEVIRLPSRGFQSPGSNEYGVTLGKIGSLYPSFWWSMKEILTKWDWSYQSICQTTC